MGATHGEHGAELNEPNLYPTLRTMEAERLIQGEWHEGDRTRRLYRVASRAAVIADQRGWPPLSHPLGRDEMSAEDDPETSPATAVATTIPEFVDRLDAALPVSNACRTDVIHEIRDHLEDSSAEYRRLGRTPDAATTAAISGLGSPETLATRIAGAEFTRRRLTAGMGTGAVSALFGATIGLIIGALAVFLAPVLARYLVGASAQLGLHLYLPATAEWHAQQLSAALWVAAFLAARRSMPVVSQATRRSLSAIRPLWAFTGAMPLLLFALFAPSSMDATVAIARLGVPVAFVLGTLRWQRPGDDMISRIGSAQAALLLIVFLFLPGVRIWHFAPTATVAQADWTPASSPARITISGTNTLVVTGLDGSSWHDANIEFWPAVKSGLEVSPDAAAASPLLVVAPNTGFTMESLPYPPTDWWLILTATDADGSRHSLDVTVLKGNQPLENHSIFGWLLGRR